MFGVGRSTAAAEAADAAESAAAAAIGENSLPHSAAESKADLSVVGGEPGAVHAAAEVAECESLMMLLLPGPTPVAIDDRLLVQAAPITPSWNLSPRTFQIVTI